MQRENIRLRAPFLVMAEEKQALLCSFDLTKTFNLHHYDYRGNY